MPDDNVVKFRRPLKRPIPPQAGQPSWVASLIVAAVTIALVIGIATLLGGYR